MNSSPSFPPLTRLRNAVERVIGRLGDDESNLGRLGDDELLALLNDTTEARKALELVIAGASTEVSRRSTRELGYRGLAQRRGLRTGTALVQQVTGMARSDVNRAVQAGEELATPMRQGGESPGDPRAAAPEVPRWLARLRDALASGQVSQAQFHAIRVGLGDPPNERYPHLEDDFLAEGWHRAVTILLDEASNRTVEDLRDQARIARDRLDPIGVTLRFEERFAARSYRAWTDESGQRHARIAFDDEAAAWFDAILRAALRPRRGPRFVDSASDVDGGVAAPDGARDGAGAGAIPSGGAAAGGGAAGANGIGHEFIDDRSNEQLQYDTIMAVMRTGASADPAQAFGDRQPGVRIVVEAGAIDSAADRGETHVTGVGHLEDGGQALPAAIVEKYLCDAGAQLLSFNSRARPLDVGRQERLFTRAQRVAIAARDGGCIIPGCDRPPSECEYHHIDHWWEHHGRTDVDDGVPLCRNCHMRLHNGGWRIVRRRDPVTGLDTYWLHAPPDPHTGEVPEPVLLRTKSPRRFAAA